MKTIIFILSTTTLLTMPTVAFGFSLSSFAQVFMQAPTLMTELDQEVFQQKVAKKVMQANSLYIKAKKSSEFLPLASLLEHHAKEIIEEFFILSKEEIVVLDNAVPILLSKYSICKTKYRCNLKPNINFFSDVLKSMNRDINPIIKELKKKNLE